MLRDISLFFILILLTTTVLGYSIQELKSQNEYTNYNIALETNELVLQPNSTDFVYLAVSVNTIKPMALNISILDYPEVRADVQSNINTVTDFERRIEIKVFNASPGIYPLKVLVTSSFEGRPVVKEEILYVKIVEKQAYKFATTRYTNILPEIKSIEFDKRNFFLAPGEKGNLSVKILNAGSTADFSIDYFPKTDDLNINFQRPKLMLTKDLENTYFGTISVSEKYDKEFTTLKLMLLESSTGMMVDLGTINITLAKANLVVQKIIDENTITITVTNKGTVEGVFKIKSGKTEINEIILPGSTKTYILPKDKTDLFSDEELIESMIFEEINKLETFDINKSTTGLFTLTAGNTSQMIIVIVAIFVLLYLSYFAINKSGIFGKTVNIKTLGIKE